MALIMNEHAEFVDDFDPYSKPLRVKHVGPNDRDWSAYLSYIKKEPPIRCAECGEIFTPTRTNQIYCSKKCRCRRNHRDARSKQNATKKE